MEAPFIHNWNRVLNAFPGLAQELCQAVDTDNRMG
jgi:hypothetical protein